MYRESVSITVQQDATMYSLLYFCKLLYMFRVVTPPIIRSTYNCNYSIWHWSNFRKCSVWSQLKMRVMDPSLLPSAIVGVDNYWQIFFLSLSDFFYLLIISWEGYCCAWSHSVTHIWPPLLVGSARHRGLYLTIHNIHKKKHKRPLRDSKPQS